MLEKMGRDNPLKQKDYQYLSTPSLILLGDRDNMVSLEETLLVFLVNQFLNEEKSLKN
jgi:hypothetical protein